MNEEQLKLFELPELIETEKPIQFKPFGNRIWTENKALLIQRYLFYFVMITKHGTYIDGFSGPQYTDKLNSWSAKLVLQSEPKWLRKFYLCELNNNSFKKLHSLIQAEKSNGDNRTFKTYPGDFNKLVLDILRDAGIKPSEASFCLLDQRCFECHWETVKKIANYKKEGNKIEQFYFLAEGWLDRSISGVKDKSILVNWWGGNDWEKVKDVTGLKRALLFCDRFRTLGYKYSYPFPIYSKDNGGRVMYFMIHASDHKEAPNLMARAYRLATKYAEPKEQFELDFGIWEEKHAQA